jgi:hypothetical protein
VTLVRRLALVVLAWCMAPASARADDSKLALVGEVVAPRAPAVGKNKRCCGYPLVPELAWALRFYWLAREEDFDEPDEIDYGDVDAVDVYDRRGFYVGTFSRSSSGTCAWRARACSPTAA